MGNENEVDAVNVQARCPHCKSDEIVAADTVLVTAGISGWQRQPDGSLEPVWAGSSDADWDSQTSRDPERPYACGDCEKMLSAAELLIDVNEECDDE